MKVALLAPNIDGTDVGEAFVAFKWAEALASLVDLTVLSFERPGRRPLAEQIPKAQTITWPEPPWARRHERLNAMAKPAWPVFSRHVRKWLEQHPDFDLAHQLMPQAARYPSPLRHGKIPYIIGPLGGALDTPVGFRKEAGSAPLFTRLRGLDSWRFRNDPWLRTSYTQAACILGVAPYVREILQDVPIKRFEPVLELGIDNVAPTVPRAREQGHLRLLHVGRGVRTKGLRDVVRAMPHLPESVQMTSAGGGEEIALAQSEAKALGIDSRCRFLGRISREKVEHLYRTHDVFTFPSFREPAGGVLYEAMRWGLPVITAARGGPDWIIDDSCGIRIPISTPAALSHDIAVAVKFLLENPKRRRSMGDAARAKVAAEGVWTNKAQRLLKLYLDILQAGRAGSAY